MLALAVRRCPPTRAPPPPPDLYHSKLQIDLGSRLLASMRQGGQASQAPHVYAAKDRNRKTVKVRGCVPRPGRLGRSRRAGAACMCVFNLKLAVCAIRTYVPSGRMCHQDPPPPPNLGGSDHSHSGAGCGTIYECVAGWHPILDLCAGVMQRNAGLHCRPAHVASASGCHRAASPAKS